jgi:hypothetical protein
MFSALRDPMPYPSCLNRPATGKEIDDENDNGDNQKQMNIPAGNVKTPSQKPQNDQDGKNCPQHSQSPPARKFARE